MYESRRCLAERSLEKKMRKIEENDSLLQQTGSSAKVDRNCKASQEKSEFRN